MPRITFVLATMLSFMAFTPVAAQDFDKGVAALNAGDYATALQEFRPLAEQGDFYAQGMLATMYATGEGVTQDHAEAVRWWRLSAEQGFSTAQDALGISFQFGNGVPQNYAEAFRWYRLAANQGHTGAQTRLGFMYQSGKSVLQDNVMAHMWFNIGATDRDELAVYARDRIAKKMTPAAIEKAQAMARECMSSGYTKCGY